MTSDLLGLLGVFGDLSLLVVGDAMLDSYLECTSGRLCREAPVPVVTLAGRRDAPGGAANTAVNVRSLGARARFLSVVGDDPEGGLLRRHLEGKGVDVSGLLVDPGRRTLTKQRVLAESQMLLRLDQGSTEPLAPAVERALIGRLLDLAPRLDGLIVSDYGYGILTRRLIRVLEGLRPHRPPVLVVDSRTRLGAFRRVAPTAVKPNYHEALGLLGAGDLEGFAGRADGIAAHADRILEATGARIAAVTLDTDGAILFERGRPHYRTYARPERHCHAAGAGDTFVAALTLALAAGAEAPAAAELASAAAAVVVGKAGTANCPAPELAAYLTAGEARVAPHAEGLAAALEAYRRRGRRIVFTNGCFDILHRGHVTLLNRAKALGDVLIVGVNSDEGIRRLKGPRRPINTLEDRMQVLAALSCIDHLVAFDDDSPREMIRAIRPDVYVKGGDYDRQTLPEAPLVEALGGEVRILPFVEDRSTTDIIERIRAVYDGDAPEGRRDGVLAPAGGGMVAGVASPGGSGP